MVWWVQPFGHASLLFLDSHQGTLNRKKRPKPSSARLGQLQCMRVSALGSELLGFELLSV